MKIKHLIIDASILVKFPQTKSFFEAAGNYCNGRTSYFRSHSVPRADSWFMLKLLQNKGIDIVVYSKMGKVKAAQVMNAYNIQYSQCVDNPESIGSNPEDYLVVAKTVAECDAAKTAGFHAIRFREGNSNSQYEILSAVGIVRKSESKHNNLV